MSRRFYLPGAGFVVLVVGWILVIGFLLWGVSTPLLDRVWQMNQRMEHEGFQGLENDEVEDLEEAIARHPDLGRQILGNRLVRLVEPSIKRWCALSKQHLVFSEDWAENQVLVIDADFAPEVFPVELHLVGAGLDNTIELVAPGPAVIPLSFAEGEGPVLVRALLSAEMTDGPWRGLKFTARPQEVDQ